MKPKKIAALQELLPVPRKYVNLKSNDSLISLAAIVLICCLLIVTEVGVFVLSAQGDYWCIFYEVGLKLI